VNRTDFSPQFYLRLSLICAAATAFGAVSASAQTLRGNVVDAETGESISAATVSLVDEAGRVRVTGTSAQDGAFMLNARAGGSFRVSAERIGYLPMNPQEVVIGTSELVLVRLELARSPVTLAPITVTGVRRDPRNDASFEGALARRDLFPSVGTRRVVVRSDPEMRNAMVVAEVVQWFPARRGCRSATSVRQRARPQVCGCTIVYWNGMVVGNPGIAAFYLDDLTTEAMEAVEYYRSWLDAPPQLKDSPAYIADPYRCAVIALWPRVSADG